MARRISGPRSWTARRPAWNMGSSHQDNKIEDHIRCQLIQQTGFDSYGNDVSKLILAAGMPFQCLFEFQQNTGRIQRFCGQWRNKSNTSRSAECHPKQKNRKRHENFARFHLSSITSFSVVGPSAWNDLPVEQCSLLMTHPSKFYISLKFFFFGRDWERLWVVVSWRGAI